MTSLFEVDLSQNENGEDAWGIYNSTTNPDRSDYYSTISGEIIALKEKTDNSLNLFYYDISSSLKNSKNEFIAKKSNYLTYLSNTTITYNTPYNFSTIKTQSFTSSLSSQSTFENLVRILISPDSGTTYLSIDDNFNLVFVKDILERYS